MTLSVKRLEELRALLQEQLGDQFNEQDLERTVRAILAFVLHKELRKHPNTLQEIDHERIKT